MAGVEEEVTELSRQVERSSMFMQASFDKVLGRMAGTESFLSSLVGLLRSKGVITPDDFEEEEEEEEEEATDPAASAPPAAGPGSAAPAGEPSPDPLGGAVPPGAIPSMDSSQVVAWPAVAIGVEPEDPPSLPPVNCAERMHICKAVCCRLSFALTAEEIDAGRVRWDLGFPYLIRHDAEGTCVHNEAGTHRCTVYGDRPGVCRRYSCATDARIWKDFAAMELNEEWLAANLAEPNRIRISRQGG